MRAVLCLLFLPLLYSTSTQAEEGTIDIRGGIFEGRIDTQPHERESRYEDIRKNRVDRNPRNKPERQLADQVLDATVDGTTANTAKHGLDALQNINEAIEIRQHRLEGNGSSNATAD